MARAFPIDPGERDRLVTIQQRNDVDAVDDAGAPLETWTPLAQAYAAKLDMRGQERLAASQMAAQYDTRWLIGYRADMDPELVDVPKLRRVVYKGRAHDITEALMIGRRDGIELMTITSSQVPQ